MAITERIDPPWEPPLGDPDWEFRTALTDDPDYLYRLYDESVVHARARLAAAWAVAS